WGGSGCIGVPPIRPSCPRQIANIAFKSRHVIHTSLCLHIGGRIEFSSLELIQGQRAAPSSGWRDGENSQLNRTPRSSPCLRVNLGLEVLSDGIRVEGAG